MRIRSTKPEFWRSKRIAAVRSWEARLVLKGLESYVDDNGVGKDDLALIVTDVFPRDMTLSPQDTLLRVQVAVNTLHEAGLVHRYDHEGTDLLYISWWDSTQYINRPSKGRLRRPDGTLEYGESEIGGPDLSPQEDVLSPQSLNRGTGEQGTGEQVVAATPPAKRKRHEYPDDFEEFWQAFPAEGRKDKPKVLAAWKKATATTSASEILAGAKSYASDRDRDPKYTKYAQGWLTGERWTDAPAPATRTRNPDAWMQNT